MASEKNVSAANANANSILFLLSMMAGCAYITVAKCGEATGRRRYVHPCPDNVRLIRRGILVG